MCYSSEVSLLTYSTGMLGCWYLYKSGRKIESIFYAWVIQMQLIEFFLWRNQFGKNSSQSDLVKYANKVFTYAGILVNHAEPIVLWLAVMYYTKKKLPLWVTSYMLMFTIVISKYTMEVLMRADYTTVTKESSPHLYWKWNNGDNGKVIYGIFLGALIVLFCQLPKTGKFNAFLATVSFGLSYYIYRDKKVVGSMWCFASAFAPWILLAY